MILPADEIFDRVAVTSAITRLADAAGGKVPNPDLRPRIVAILSDANTRGRAAIAAAFEAQPFAGEKTTRAYAWLTDCLVTTAVDATRS